jgi:trans-2-enoyl-CoA reductase
VVAVPDQVGAWQEFCEADVDDLILLPALVPYNQLAVSLLNPMTAWRLLNDFEYLREGDVIIQNAGNSAVGLAVLQFAKRMGVTCINLVRKEERIADLKNFGGEQVWIDDEDVPRKVFDFTEKKGCLMALNSVGGRSAVRLARCVRQGGVHVTFGAMDSDPIRFPTRNLIFDDVRFVGFWLDRWKSRQSPAQLRNSLEEVLQPLAMKEVSYPIDSVYSIEEYAEAISRNSKSRFGKVLLARDKQRIESSVS